LASKNLETYLNDHLAGAAAAVALLEKLEQHRLGTPSKEFVAGIRREIEADREELRRIMERVGVAESAVRQSAGWLASKLTTAKLRIDDLGGNALYALEALEALSLGIEGKHGLWVALRAAAKQHAELAVADYERLTKRAEEQRSAVENVRVDAATHAFVAS
jgi:hypothetical protein